MSLLSTDITKVKRITLKEVKLPPPAPKDTEPPKRAVKPPQGEQRAYNRLLEINPLLGELVEAFDLVSQRTGRPIGERPQPVAEPIAPQVEAEPQGEPDTDKLTALAQQILQEADSYSKGEVIERIIEATQVSPQRAERGFLLMLQAGAIDTAQGDKYYLTGSTPF